MGNKLKAKVHLDIDPNDPRNRVPASTGFSLNDEPEAEIEPKEVVEVVSERPNTAGSSTSPVWDKEQVVTVTTRLGLDPNDARLVNR